MPAMTPAQEASWHGLLDLYERLPSHWSLIGGQMVHLHCAERGFSPRRPTPDVDTVLDVQANPQILLSFTQALLDLNFSPAGVTGSDKQHRFVRGEASVDVLIPRGVGERLPRHRGATGSETVQAPGGIQALRRSSTVEVTVAGRSGSIRRPSLVRALIVKAAAHTLPVDLYRGRHRSDFATLGAMVSRADFSSEVLTKREKRYLRDMVMAVQADPTAVDGIPEAVEGLQRLALVLDR